MNKHLVLVGMMGSGKSTVGRWLAERLDLPFVDTDAWIEAEGKTISEIFQTLGGERTFRQKERLVVLNLLKEKPLVIATGGGLFLDPDNRVDLCKAGKVFYLHATAEELASRTQKGTHRPLLHGKDHLIEIKMKLDSRAKYYAEAHHRIEAGGRSIKEIGEEILGLWKKES